MEAFHGAAPSAAATTRRRRYSECPTPARTDAATSASCARSSASPDVAHWARKAGDDLRRLHALDCVDRPMGVGSRHGPIKRSFGLRVQPPLQTGDEEMSRVDEGSSFQKMSPTPHPPVNIDEIKDFVFSLAHFPMCSHCW